MLQYENTMGSVFFFLTAQLSESTRYTHVPIHKNRQLYKMYAKISTGRKAKVFKIKWLSQNRREKIWKVVSRSNT